MFSKNICIKNNKLNMEKIVGFNLITLIGELNSDICKNVELTKLKNNNSTKSALLTVVLQHFFEDVGCPQVYIQSLVQMHQTTQNNLVTYRFTMEPCTSQHVKLHDVPTHCLQVFAECAECVVECISLHHLKISINFKIEKTQLEQVPTFALPLINTLTLKGLQRVKDFIENM